MVLAAPTPSQNTGHSLHGKPDLGNPPGPQLMSATDPSQAPTDPPPAASVPGSDIPDPPASTPKEPRRVSRDRPNFDGTPTVIKIGYVLIAVALLALFAMAAMSVLG